ncbi:DUF305 domain-containing protein [Streptomyces sp. NPDC015131]|uniref:DUF305 domain-containing protein n=1 Tax=Streptomyces sp. NPDC015131 TaxID=3364941 RepID=UPI0036F984D9
MSARRRPTRFRTAAARAAVTAAVLTLAACGATGESPAPGAGRGSTPSATDGRAAHNAADVAFAQGMIPHHRQAVAMADLAPGRASDPEVTALAAAVKKAQAPEIRTLSGWLTTWGEPVPAEDAPAGHSGHGQGHGTEMTGMMTGQEMARLEKATGPAFDTAFLTLMIKHHQGAVAMAKTERDQGAHPPATAMADDIIASQSAEIARMKALLGAG